jgi:gliding motility-associated-like protein
MTNQLNQSSDFDFGDGHQTVQSTSASNRYDEAGTYTITCTTGTKTLEATVEILGQISSAFSPNGDGINDLFTVGNADVQNVEISVFNRYGKLVFSGKGKTVNWDGRLQNGISAESGTYFYDIFVTSGNGNFYKQKGTINLFR